MESFLVRLFIAIGIIWLTQVVLAALKIKEPASEVIFIVVLFLSLIFVVTGNLLT